MILCFIKKMRRKAKIVAADAILLIIIHGAWVKYWMVQNELQKA
jgi:hypothetical protein